MAPFGVANGISASLRLRLRYAPIPTNFIHHFQGRKRISQNGQTRKGSESWLIRCRFGPKTH
ncbi:MAG: hypothetical protein A3H32_00630 [Betaproteobacteria bacterium RIFCSPLOWO2_02_FULL_63_19]|nr:MAG: hypothetical protein A3H32_00630 [Betaproteobacteria bacterium RIFCSPLOWO2_02_FULL_63_19]